MTVAHSAPVYVLVDGQPFWKRDSVASIAAEQRARLDELITAEVDARGDLEPWETFPLMQQEWERQRLMLKARVAEASERYQRLADRAAASRSAPIGPFALLIGCAAVLLVARHRPFPQAAEKRSPK